MIADSEAELFEWHSKAGFRVLGIRFRLGCLSGRWRDIVLLKRGSLIART